MITELAPGLWRWATPHPEWSAGDFGAEVACFALEAGDELLLVDPLLPRAPATVLERLDALAAGRTVHVLVTIHFHVRSADDLADRFDATIWGPPDTAEHLREPGRLRELAPGRPGPCGTVAFNIGTPPRVERPVWLPSHAAVAFGDALVTTPAGELRVWLTGEQQGFLDDRFPPTLQPLVELGPERILVTHGAPVLEDGTAALRAALVAPPWEHPG